MTDRMSGSALASLGCTRAVGHRPTIYLVSGVLDVTDADLPAALHKLADHADLCSAGCSTTTVGGIVLHGRLKLTWNIAMPSEEMLPTLVESPDPQANYRLLTITVTTFAHAG